MVNDELDNLWDSTISKFKKVGIAILILLVIILLLRNCHNTRTIESNKTLQSALSDTLKVMKQKDGSSKATISVLQAQNVSAFTQLHSTQEDVLKLQKLAEKYKSEIKNHGSITVVETQGDVDIKIPTQVVDTSKQRSIYPIYSSPFNKNGWVWGNIEASKDSISLSLKYRDEFDLVIGREKTGFLGLGKGKPFADLTSKSPYTEIKQFRVYETEAKPEKRFSIGPVAAYGFGTSSLTPQFFIGIGGSYNLIKF